MSTKTMKPLNGTAPVLASPATRWRQALSEAQGLRVRCDEIRAALARAREDRVTAVASAIVEGRVVSAVDVASLPDGKLQAELTAAMERIESLELASTALAPDAMAELQRGVERDLAEINQQGIATATQLVAAWNALSVELIEVGRLSKASSDLLAEFGTMHRQHVGRPPQWNHRAMFPISTGEIWGRLRALVGMNAIGALTTKNARWALTMETIQSPAARRAAGDDIEVEDIEDVEELAVTE